MSPTGPIGQCLAEGTSGSELATVELGDAARFAILATTAVTDAGGSQINGDIGTTGTTLPIYPISPLPSGLQGTLPHVEGTSGLHNKDATAHAARSAAIDAWNVIKGRCDCEKSLGGIVELGGRILKPGLYTSTISFHSECICALHLTYTIPSLIQLNP